MADNEGLFKEFKTITEHHTFKPGEGLPGRVYESRKPAWIKDVTQDPNFPRSKLASDIGVKGAFSFPVYGKNDISYVLEFYSPKAEDMDSSILSFMEQISYEITNNLEL